MPIHEDPYAEADAAITELRVALERHGVVFPNLGLDLGSIALGVAAVQLGSVPAETVRQIVLLLS